MSASIVARRYLGRLVALQLLRRTASSRLLQRGVFPSASSPVARPRPFSVDSSKHGGRDSQEFDSQKLGVGLEQEESRKAEDDEAEYEHSIKQRILNAALGHVEEHGWSKKALEAGAQSEGLPPVAHGMFERGGAEIVHHLYKKCNADLAEMLRQEVQKREEDGLEKPKTRAFVQKAVQARLRMIIPYHSIWKEAMAVQALPQNAPEAWQNLMNLCDDIWYYEGDRSTDFDWYTKRLSLAAIYKATEIYMLQDTSSDFQNTWIFLDNRLNDINRLQDMKKSLGPLMEGITGLISMGRNMAGMNSRNR